MSLVDSRLVFGRIAPCCHWPIVWGAGLWLAVAGGAVAQSASPPTVSESSVVITAAREPLPAERVAGDVVIITSATIRNSTADSLGDLLRREAGLQLTRAGGPGQGTAALIRGANGGQTVVLVDGVRIGSATLGLTALEQIGLADIERIEVLKGPGSSLYGADAIGGVVQIFTRQAQAGHQVSAQAWRGGLGSHTTGAAWGHRTALWDLNVSMSHEGSQGVSVLRPGDQWGHYNPDADGYDLRSFQARGGWRPAPGQHLGLSLVRTRLNAQYDGSEYAPPDYLPNPLFDFRNRVVTEATTAQWQADWTGGWASTVRASTSRDDAQQGALTASRYHTQREQVLAQLAAAWSPQARWVAALESATESASSTSYGADVKRQVRSATLALTGSGRWGAWQTEIRRDHYSDWQGVTTARWGHRWPLSQAAYVRALAGTTFRAPSFNDLVYPGYGIPSLKPERGRSLEVAWGWSPSSFGWSGEMVIYQNRVSDLIGYESDRRWCPADPAYDFGCARNIAQARLQGASLRGLWRGGAWVFQGQWEFVDAKDTASGQRLSRRAAQQGHVKLEREAQNWSWSAQILHVGSRPDSGKQLDAETTLDLQARWRWAPEWELLLKLLNATNVDTEPSRDYRGIGRQAWVGLRYGM